MEIREALDILESHNRWRRGEEGVPICPATKIGEAIDKAIEALRSFVIEEQNIEDSQVGQLVRCENCDGTGIISYNPNLNPNEFPGYAHGNCTRCNGTGIEWNAGQQALEESTAHPSGTAIVRGNCERCEKAKTAIKKIRNVIETGNMQVNELWAQITVGDAIELFKEVIDEKESP